MRTVPNVSHLFSPLEDVIRYKMIPLLTGWDNITDEERQILALPCCLGGMGLINPTAVADEKLESSHTITSPLIFLILEKKYGMKDDLYSEMKSKKAEITQTRRAKQESTASDLLDHLTGKLKKNVQFEQEKGASIWLTSLPTKVMACPQQERVPGCHCSQVWLDTGSPSTIVCL